MKIYTVPASKLSAKTLKAEAYIPGAAVQHRLERIRASLKRIRESAGLIDQLLNEIDDIEEGTYRGSV